MKTNVKQDLDRLASFGITSSFVYGPCGDKGIWWSANVLTLNGKTFEHPYLANSLDYAIEIIFNECRKRGWLNDTSLRLNK